MTTAPINREIRVGDVRTLLRDLPDESVNCVVTSPPYWGLRDYGVDGQIGLEETPEAFVAVMVEVFSEIRRVLRADGTLWLNLGDSYVSAPPGNKREDLARSRDVKGPARRRRAWNEDAATIHPTRGARGDRLANGHGKITARKTFRRDGAAVGGPAHLSAPDLKLKDKVGIPWRVAFALQAEGWYLRSDIIWAKPNPMPEAVLDRPTSAHEYVFLFSKSPRYFYDAKAIREPVTGRAHPRGDGVNPKAGPKDDARNDQGLKTSTRFGRGAGFRTGKNETPNGVLGEHRTRAGFNERWRTKQNASFSGAVTDLVDERNKRSVWTVVSEPYSGAHFATFPKKLVEPCILAGCPAGGLVLDPFGGSGTVGEVAEQLGRRWMLLELNPVYADLARVRTAQRGLFADAAAAALVSGGGGLRILVLTIQTSLSFARRMWWVVDRDDPRARALADRHYSRQTPGAAEFMSSGKTLVLLTECMRAVWGVIENLDPMGELRWRCSIFRNEGAGLSSDLIREATPLTFEWWRNHYGALPPVPLRTEVDPKRTRRKRDPGRCFIRAGWRDVGKRGLTVLEAPTAAALAEAA